MVTDPRHERVRVDQGLAIGFTWPDAKACAGEMDIVHMRAVGRGHCAIAGRCQGRAGNIVTSRLRRAGISRDRGAGKGETKLANLEQHQTCFAAADPRNRSRGAAGRRGLAQVIGKICYRG